MTAIPAAHACGGRPAACRPRSCPALPSWLSPPGATPALCPAVEWQALRGDPMSPLRWTTKSTRHLAAELTRLGHRVSADTVGDLLRAEGFSLQGNAKTIEGKQH